VIDLTTALQQQLNALEQLKATLEQELELVVARDADSLLTLVEEKQVLLDNIDGNDALVKASQTELNEQQQQLLEEATATLKACQQQTEVNALVVEKSQIRVQRIRDLMIASRNKESLTYTNKGKTQGGLAGGGIKA